MDPDMAVFAACDGAAIVGFGCAGRSESEERAAELFALYLDPTVIGKGVGRSLFEACIGHAKARGFRTMTTTVLTRHDVARRFYERMQGRLLSGTEKPIETGGTSQTVVTYCWGVA
jgi:GNAT superfamily N-acetyltransferase